MYTHKTGDTWSMTGQADVKDLLTGAKADLTGWTLASQLRSADTHVLIAAFDCTLIDPLLQTFTHRATDTTAWPPGLAVLDVQLTGPQGEVVSTDTQTVRIVSDVTRAASTASAAA